MSESVLIIGASGSGKSTSIRTLEPSETYIINIIGKALPFKGWKNSYKEGEGNNMYVTDKPEIILKCLQHINDKREDIKNIIIDDFQYVMSNEFMRRIRTDMKRNEVFDFYNEIASDVFIILEKIRTLRNDLFVFVLSHSEKTDDGFSKFKTIGKLTDRGVMVEGRFTVILQSLAKDGNYFFKTNNDGDSICKSSSGMFEDKLIPNDLAYVRKKIEEF